MKPLTFWIAMFVLQETTPYTVNSQSAASNQQNDQRFYAEKTILKKIMEESILRALQKT